MAFISEIITVEGKDYEITDEAKACELVILNKILKHLVEASSRNKWR